MDGPRAAVEAVRKAEVVASGVFLCVDLREERLGMEDLVEVESTG